MAIQREKTITRIFNDKKRRDRHTKKQLKNHALIIHLLVFEKVKGKNRFGSAKKKFSSMSKTTFRNSMRITVKNVFVSPDAEARPSSARTERHHDEVTSYLFLCLFGFFEI